MPCEVRIQTTIYNSVTGKSEIIPKAIGIAEQNEIVTLEQAARYIAALSQEDRDALVNTLNNARRQTITDDMIKNYQFIGNTTVAELFDLYGIPKGLYNLDQGLFTKYNIVRGSSFKVNNMERTGRVVTANGRELFIIKDKFGALKFLKYMQTRELANKIFGPDGQIPESIVPYMDDLKVIADHNKMSMLDTVIGHLNDFNSFEPFRHKGKVYTPRQVLSKIIAAINDEYNPDDARTDLELALLGVKMSNKGYDWKFQKGTLYDTLVTYFPDFGQRMSKREFSSLSATGLENVLLGKDGLFIGHPKLESAKIKNVTQGKEIEVQPNKQSTTKEITVTAEIVKSLWPSISTNINNLPATYQEYRKLTLEQQIKQFNDARFLYIGEDGEQHLLKAIPAKTKGGRDTVKYQYEYEKVNTPSTRETPSYVTFEFPYSSIGQIYNFSYKTTPIFEPVTVNEDPDVVNGKYRGMNIYKGIVGTGNKQHLVYLTSRNLISPNSYMATHVSLAEAKHYIDTKFQTDIINDNSLLSIKQIPGTPRVANVEMKGLMVGQTLTTLDLPLNDKNNINNWPSPFKQLMAMTVSEFQDRLADISDIQTLNTPEKAAAFIFMTTELLSINDLNVSVQGNQLNNLIQLIKSPYYADGIKGIITQINNAPEVHYLIEKIITTKPTAHSEGRRLATLKLIPDGGISIDANSKTFKIGDQLMTEFIGQTVTAAAEFFGKLGVPVNAMTQSELASLQFIKDAGLVPKLDSIKGFVHEGQIYLNTSNSDASDLYHEMAHIFLGIMKVKYPEAYSQLAHYYQTNKNMKRAFANRLNWVSSDYSTFSMQDRVEEAIVHMIADDLFANGQLLESETGFNTDIYVQTMNKIMQQVDAFKGSTSDNGFGFNEFMKALSEPGVATEMRKQRILSNFVRAKIEDKTIIEDCK